MISIGILVNFMKSASAMAVPVTGPNGPAGTGSGTWPTGNTWVTGSYAYTALTLSLLVAVIQPRTPLAECVSNTAGPMWLNSAATGSVATSLLVGAVSGVCCRH